MTHARIPRIHRRADDSAYGVGAASAVDLQRVASDNLRREIDGPYRRARGLLTTVSEFAEVYAQYRKHHPRSYALQTAWRIAVVGAPF